MMNSSKQAETSHELLPLVVGLIHAVSAKSKGQPITPDTLLLEELSLDSLDLVRLFMLIEDRHHVVIDLDEVPNMKRVRDLTAILGKQLRTAA